MGEGFLRSLKPEIKNGLRYKWQAWVLNNYLERKAFDMVSLLSDRQSERAGTVGEDQFRIYPTEAAAIRRFEAGAPVSCVCFDAKYGMVYRCNGIIKVLPLRATKLVGSHNRVKYFSFSVLKGEGDDDGCFGIETIPTPLVGAILLPRITLEGRLHKHNGHPESTVITSTWKTSVAVETISND